MIKFEEHDGKLFRMLEKPVPLTDDTELPVLVRMIQDDTMLGKRNKRSCHPDALAQKIICIELTDDGLFMDGNYTYRYEIIGIPVAEGSSEWRNYQLVQGKCVYHPGDSEYYQASGQGRIIGKIIENNEFNSTWNSDTFMRDDSDGWQIYKEQKPLLADAKVGDLVKLRKRYRRVVHGSYSQIAEVKEGSAEWALYQMMQGNKVRQESFSMPKVHCAMNEKRQIAIFTTPSSMIDGGDVICHANDWLTSRQVDAMIDERTGWQLYEPKPEPEPDKEDMHLRSGKDNPERQDFNGYNRYDYIPVDGIKMQKQEPQYKVGDWVEIESSHVKGKTFVSVIKKMPNNQLHQYQEHYTVRVNCSFGGYTVYGVMERQIIRKLKPSEVVVKIGCLSGTVEPVSINGIHIWFHLIGVDDKTIATICISSLDTPTRELVESLLEAQGEGDKPCES